jgi:hypothetical protein
MEILDFNHCHCKLTCNCGWNVQLGSTSEVELMKLRKFLKENNMIKHDNTKYKEKFLTEQF